MSIPHACLPPNIAALDPAVRAGIVAAFDELLDIEDAAFGSMDLAASQLEHRLAAAADSIDEAREMLTRIAGRNSYDFAPVLARLAAARAIAAGED